MSLSSDDLDDDKDNIDLSFIKNKNLKDNKRTKTCEKISKVPKLDFKSVMQNYKNPPNIKVIGDKLEQNSNNNNIDDNILNQKYKSQIDIYKKTISNYKEKINKLRKQIN